MAGAAAWMTLPRKAALDWELYFKICLTTLIRGPLETEDASADDWVALARTRVWYHPGARDLEQKLTDPNSYTIPSPARSGEMALMEALQKLPDPAGRLAHLIEGGGDEVLYDDPANLGEAYDPQRVLGMGATWEDVASWSERVVEGLGRRNEHNHWAVIGDPDDALATALATFLGEGRVHAISTAAPDDLAEALSERLEQASDRLILIGRGDGAAAAVRCLHAQPGLRDRTLAVLAIGGRFGGETADWLAEQFDHVSMDTEISRATPYLHLAFVTPGVAPPGDAGRPLAETRWPAPETPPTGRVSIEALDLGVLPGPESDYPAELLARAIALTISARLAIS